VIVVLERGFGCGDGWYGVNTHVGSTLSEEESFLVSSCRFNFVVDNGNWRGRTR
jgi:hypothetical protein